MKIHQTAWKLSLAIAGALFCYTPTATARVTPTPLPETAELPQQMPVQIAQGRYCPDGAGGTPLVNFYETDNFWVYICEADGLYYYGVEKGSGSSITLPVEVEEGTGYVAVNGEYTYIVNGLSLSIYRGNTLLQEDSVYRD
ncbi:hypothetical protein [Laspinema olomoucense]|uniref:hypothetical protein n=1 Tax=Laspinema olomoucense TaxID=3231600 RepID=UPI0021BA661C|nr:hypothetical protein [Laspinema sp. D3c]MCT7993052.1 hypothetical protein [Laspinema sp. D3c]